jgi:hypothetical protein
LKLKPKVLLAHDVDDHVIALPPQARSFARPRYDALCRRRDIIMAAEGGVGFCGKYPCPWCMVTRSELGVKRESPAKTHKFLCNASHMPSHLGPLTPPYICAKQYKNQAAVHDKDKYEGTLHGCNSNVIMTKCTSILPSSPLSPRMSTFELCIYAHGQPQTHLAPWHL